MKKIAFELMRKQDFDFIVVRPNVVEKWTRVCFTATSEYLIRALRDRHW